MEPEIYAEMAAQEDAHWWFRGRRAIVESLLSRLKLPPQAKIFEIGCGSGGNLPLLGRYGEVAACEMFDAARAKAAARGIAQVENGSLPDGLPFGGATFDLIALFDVLEHVKDDAASLRAIHGRLNDGGSMMLSVPAFAWLWSRHDELHHHHRRYSRRELVARVEAAGFRVTFVSYCQTLLFPLLLLARLKDRLLPSGHSTGTDTPPAWLNALFYQLFAVERHLMRFVPLPFGSTLILVASK